MMHERPPQLRLTISNVGMFKWGPKKLSRFPHTPQVCPPGTLLSFLAPSPLPRERGNSCEPPRTTSGAPLRRGFENYRRLLHTQSKDGVRTASGAVFLKNVAQKPRKPPLSIKKTQAFRRESNDMQSLACGSARCRALPRSPVRGGGGG